jgi:hypothetical protein
MALTWRNVDVPVGLTKAADQVQQSFRDVANNLKAGIDQYAGMQQNNQMAALEARLSQEQQLGNVDPLAALDAGQLRSEFGGFIDPSQARNQILNRQKGLEQKLVGDFNEAYQQGNSDQMTNLSQQLMGREGDFSEVENKLRTFDLGKLIEEGNFEGAGSLARTDQERTVIGNAAYNRFLAEGNLTEAKKYVRTPEQQMLVDQKATQQVINTLGATTSKEFERYRADPNLNEKDFIDSVNKKISALSFEQQGPARQALGYMVEEMAQRMTNKVTIAPQATPFITRSLDEAPAAVDRILAAEKLTIDRQEALTGTLSQLGTSAEVLNQNFGKVDASELNNLIKELDKKRSWGFLGNDFGIEDVIERAKEAGIPLENYSVNAILMAIAGTEFNRFWLGDKEENETFKDNLDAISERIKGQVGNTFDFKKQRAELEIKKSDLLTNLQSQIIDKGNKLTVASLGNRPIDGNTVLGLNPNGMIQQIYDSTEAARLTGRNSTVGTNKPENVLGALRAGTDGNTGNTDNNNPQPPAPVEPADPITSTELRKRMSSEDWEKQRVATIEANRLKEAEFNKERERVLNDLNSYSQMSQSERSTWLKENLKYLTRAERNKILNQ